MPQLLGFVVVGADGTTLHASGVSKVDHISTGVYHVTFTASVADSCEIASLGNYETAGYATAYGIPPVGPNVVEVTTFNANAEVQDLTFQLLVVGEETGSPAATLSSTTFDFVPIIEDSGHTESHDFTLTNTGSAPLVITATSLSNADPKYPGLSISTQTCEGATLAPGESCMVTVLFDPSGPRWYDATLTFTDNASDNPQQVSIHGECTPQGNN